MSSNNLEDIKQKIRDILQFPPEEFKEQWRNYLIASGGIVNDKTFEKNASKIFTASAINDTVDALYKISQDIPKEIQYAMIIIEKEYKEGKDVQALEMMIDFSSFIKSTLNDFKKNAMQYQVLKNYTSLSYSTLLGLGVSALSRGTKRLNIEENMKEMEKEIIMILYQTAMKIKMSSSLIARYIYRKHNVSFWLIIVLFIILIVSLVLIFIYITCMLIAIYVAIKEEKRRPEWKTTRVIGNVLLGPVYLLLTLLMRA